MAPLIYLTLALEGGVWSASRPSDFTAGKDISYSLSGSLGGPLFQELNPSAPHPQPCHCSPI